MFKKITLFLIISHLNFSCGTQEVLLVKENTPLVITKSASSITRYYATLNGEVTDEGFTATTDRGFVYSETNTNPSVSDSKVQSGYGKGVYSALLDKLMINTKYYFKAYATNSKGTVYGESQSFTTQNNNTKIVDVKSKTGRIWMDRNLGAAQAATNLTDALAQGDLYQWGRSEDGHQKRTSATTNSLINTYTESNSSFVLPQSQPYDWLLKQNDNLWNGKDGINNPCPSGYHIPTLSEWQAEFTSYKGGNILVFLSPHKFIQSGFRSAREDGKVNVIDVGFYWTSTVVGNTNNAYVAVFETYKEPYTQGFFRANGACVRCIKD